MTSIPNGGAGHFMGLIRREVICSPERWTALNVSAEKPGTPDSEAINGSGRGRGKGFVLSMWQVKISDKSRVNPIVIPEGRPQGKRTMRKSHCMQGWKLPTKGWGMNQPFLIS